MYCNFIFGFKKDNQYKMTTRVIYDINYKIYKQISAIIEALKEISEEHELQAWLETQFDSLEVIQNQYRNIEDPGEYAGKAYKIDAVESAKLRAKDILEYLQEKPLKRIYDEYSEIYSAGYDDHIRFAVLINLNTKCIEIYQGESCKQEKNNLGDFRSKEILKKYDIPEQWSIFAFDNYFIVHLISINYENIHDGHFNKIL